MFINLRVFIVAHSRLIAVFLICYKISNVGFQIPVVLFGSLKAIADE